MNQGGKGSGAPGAPPPFPNMNGGGAPGFGFPPMPPGFGSSGPASGQTFDTTAKAVGETHQPSTFLMLCTFPHALLCVVCQQQASCLPPQMAASAASSKHRHFPHGSRHWVCSNFQLLKEGLDLAGGLHLRQQELEIFWVVQMMTA